MNVVLDVLRYLGEHEISLAAAARAAGVAPQNIKKSLEANPKTSTVLAIGNGLGINPREFFYDLDADPQQPSADTAEGETEQGDGATEAQVGFFVFGGKKFKIVEVE